MDGCMTGDVILDAVSVFQERIRRIPGNLPGHVPCVARSDCSSRHVTQPTSPIGRDPSSSFALADLARKGQNACLKAGLMSTEVVLAKEEKKNNRPGGASNDLRGGSKPRGGQRASDASARRTAPAGNTIAAALDLSSPSVNWPQIVAGGRMPGNPSLRLSTPAGPLFKGSAPPAAPNATSPEWEAPTFTVAARCRVAATLALFVFAALSNLSVLISVRWGRGYRLAAHLRPLIASLASADLLMTFVVMPLDAVWNMTVQWYAGDVLCKLLCFLKLFAMHSAAFILVVVSLDRYRAILHPLDSLDAGLRNKRMLLVAWMLSLLLASPQLFIFRAIKAEGADFTQCASHGSFRHRWQETAYNMFHFVTLYVFPLLVMTFCYGRILAKITGQMRKSKDGERCLRRSGKDQIPRARMKTLKMSIVIVSSFVICWTPYYLLGIWYWFQPTMIRHTPEYVHHVLFVFGNLNTCCDPVIYGFYTTSFRADLADAMACCRGRRGGEDSPRSADGLAARNTAAAAGEMESDPSSNPHSGNP